MTERVHLLAGDPPGPVADVHDDRLVVEFAGETDGTWHRYLRTEDRDTTTGLRVYVSMGVRQGRAAGCATCADPYTFQTYSHRLASVLATDANRHARLIECRDCAALYEEFPEDRSAPERITANEARLRLPGAV